MLSDIFEFFFFFGGAGQRTAMAATRAEICARHAISYFAVGKVPGDPFAFSSAGKSSSSRAVSAVSQFCFPAKIMGCTLLARAGVRARDQKSCGNLASAGENTMGLTLVQSLFFFF